MTVDGAASGGVWRVFVGHWDDGDEPDWVKLDKRGLTWEDARDLIRRRLNLFRDDDCPFCRSAAAEGVTKLDALAAGEPFEGDVDGDDYVIARFVRPQARKRRRTSSAERTRSARWRAGSRRTRRLAAGRRRPRDRWAGWQDVGWTDVGWTDEGWRIDARVVSVHRSIPDARSELGKPRHGVGH